MIGQTEVLVHPAVLMYVLYAALTGHLLFISISMASIMLHEAAHALSASLFGAPPKKLELTPLGAVMHMDDDMRLPTMKQAIVILAGPLLTFLICISSIAGVQYNLITENTARLLCMANVAILLLNILPVLPLDGGRMLMLILSFFISNRVKIAIMQLLGNILGLGLILLNIWSAWCCGGWNLSLTFAGCCLLYSSAQATITYTMAELQQFMERKIHMERRGNVRTQCISCLTTEKLVRLVRKLPLHRNAVYFCFEPGSMHMVGVVDGFLLIQHYMNAPYRNIGEILAQRDNQNDKIGTI